MNAYDSFRQSFKDIFDKNLESDDFLNRKPFRPIRGAMYSEPNLKFYQYRHTEGSNLGNLENDILTFGNPLHFNDIFEGMVKSKDGDKKIVESIIKMACNDVAIACFTETWNNQLMYAHYSRAFKGFCVEYDYKEMCKCFPEIGYFYPVIYQKSPSSLAKMKALRELIDKHYRGFKEGKLVLEKVDDLISYFVHKPDIWQYEREWRYIYILPRTSHILEETEANITYSLKNFDCISAIYLAANIGSNDEKKIRDIVNSKNSVRTTPREKIKLFKTYIKKDSYELEREQIL